MSNGVNKVILIGNLGADPELKYSQGGAAICELRLATTETWNDKSGQRKEHVEWHRCVAFGKLAELCHKYLAKGRQVYVEGKLRTRSWDDKDGNKRYMTEVNLSEVKFLGGGKGEKPAQQRDDGWGDGGGFGGDPDDNIPF